MVSSQVTLSEACHDYLETRAKQKKDFPQQELFRFARWCDWDRLTHTIQPKHIEDYCSTLEGMGDERATYLDVTKKFLTYLYQNELTPSNLTSHAKIRRIGRRTVGQAIHQQTQSSKLTAEGHRRLQEDLAELKGQIVHVVEEIRLAAATKDFSENSPLDAAREQQGQLESRIREIEAILREASVITASKGGRQRKVVRIEIGSRVSLRDVGSGRQIKYMLVHSSEADPTAGKISDASPIGKAVMEKQVGDEVTVTTPKCPMVYRVDLVR